MMPKRAFKLASVLTVGLCLLTSGCKTTENTMQTQPPGDIQRREILATDMSFDLESGKISYTLPEEALVRIRIGVHRGGALLRTLVDWEKRGKGVHEETWDKKDATGKIDFGGYSGIMLTLACLSVDGGQDISPSPGQFTQVRGFRKSPEFTVAFPQSKETIDGDVPVVQGIVPVQVTLSEKDKQWLTGTRYEVVMFLDQVFVMEEEEGLSPFNYFLNMEGFNPGYHFLTVNVAGYEGEIGTKSVKVYVK